MASDLKSFKLERVKYRQMLKTAREVKIAEKVKECGNDSKKLYTLVNNLTCRNIVTLFLDSEGDRWENIHFKSKPRHVTPQIDNLGKTRTVLRVSTHIYGVSKEIDGKTFIFTVNLGM